MGLEITNGYRDGQDFANEVRESLSGGDYDLTQPVELSFYLYLPNQAVAEQAALPLREAGFEVDVEQSADEESNTWLCFCDKEIVPSEATLAEIGELFLALAEQYNGEFDGWETKVRYDFGFSFEPDYEQVATEILAAVKAGFSPKSYNEVDPASYDHLDLTFYDETAQTLRQLGFNHVANFEIASDDMEPIDTFCMLMINPESGVEACCYCMPQGDMNVFEFTSRFNDDHSLCTTTALQDLMFNDYPHVTTEFLPESCDIESGLARHLTLLDNMLSDGLRTQAKLTNFTQMIEAIHSGEQKKAQHLKSIGWITRDYLLVQTQGDEELTDNVFAEIQKLLAN